MSGFRRAVLGNALYASVGLYADYAAGLIISIVAARSLGPVTYGTYTLLIWLASVGVVLANHGIITGVMKFVGEARGQRAPDLARAVLLYFERVQALSSLAACAALGVVMVLIGDRIVADPLARRLSSILVPAVALRSLYVFYLSAAKGFENFRLAARVQLLVAPLSIAIVLLAAHRDAGLKGFLYAYTFACLLSAAVMRSGMFRAVRRERSAARGAAPVSRIHRHMLYASAIVFFELVVLRQTELFFLGRFSTYANVAYYGIGKSLSASAMLLIPGVATALLLPMMSRTFGEDPALLGARFLAATRYLLILSVPVVIFCEVFAADVVTILYGNEYGPAVLVLRIAVAAAAVGVVSASASSYQLGSDRQPVIVGIMAAVAVLTLILDYALIRRYELAGAIAAGAVGSVLLGSGLLWHARNALRVELDSVTYARVLGAGTIAAIPAMIAHAALPVWLSLPIGTVLLVPGYFGLTIVLGAWSRTDLEAMSALAAMIPRRVGSPIRALLHRAASVTTGPEGSLTRGTRRT